MDTSLAASIEYVHRFCIEADRVPAVSGAAPSVLQALSEAGILPRPTYRVTSFGVASSIGQIGTLNASQRADAYYGPSVAPWMRRAAVVVDHVGVDSATAFLQAWLADDLVSALSARVEDATAFGWSHLVKDGVFDKKAALAEIEKYWIGWMNGGWAVCLRRFDGHHLATKEIERQRISQLAKADPAEISFEDRVALLDAIERLDAVLMPFAPHERPSGTPGQLIDGPMRRFKLP